MNYTEFQDKLQEIKNWIKADKYNIHAITEAEEMLTALLAHIAGLEADTPRRSFEHFKGAMTKRGYNIAVNPDDLGGKHWDLYWDDRNSTDTPSIVTFDEDDFEALGWDMRWLDD